ncbi:MAG TPA: DUF998 domain-containing protein [Dyella sp.]|uniref:DUF998 domain-containing protein n=1 Tax=Dyella sp. TaxID=1869338 RepID=UPI002D0E88F2|nr:DUF998 domain-containing protein [Dyella sp.]HTV83955.1 DUF998 domain-containing protein [Dyella sp.]HUB46917.1 DUF998 domain-containing protein [Acetobacteraceae bacterium]
MNAIGRSWAIRALAGLMLLAVLAFLGVCTAAQFWRTDLNWIRIPLSTYLYGPGSVCVQVVYYLMSLALLGFAWASFHATAASLRSGLAATLFAAAGLILPVVAATELFRQTRLGDLARTIHQVASPATFLWLSFAMLLLSSRWLGDPRMKKGGRAGVVLAWAATSVLWFQVLVPGLPNGLWEKLAIVLILLWLGWAALCVMRAARPA